MLKIVVPKAEYWDEIKEEFLYKKETTLVLEHSLVSISKWEAKWGKAFLGNRQKTVEEIVDYVRCMTLTQNVDPEVYSRLTMKNFDEINAYIEAPMTATHMFDARKNGGIQDTPTSELIYYWMISFNIPVEFQKWHLNRLLTLIRVCDQKNSNNKRSIREIAQDNTSINAERKKRLGTNG